MNSFVVHCKKQRYDVYIGRPGPWGNPYTIGVDGDRNVVIQKYKENLTPELIAKAKKELKGKILGCWCSPKDCHGRILAEIANG